MLCLNDQRGVGKTLRVDYCIVGYLLKGHNRQHSSQIIQNIHNCQLRYVVKIGVTKMAKSLLKQHCYHPMLLHDADHQNSCLFTNKCHFSSPFLVLIGVLAKFHE